MQKSDSPQPKSVKVYDFHYQRENSGSINRLCGILLFSVLAQISSLLDISVPHHIVSDGSRVNLCESQETTRGRLSDVCY